MKKTAVAEAVAGATEQTPEAQIAELNQQVALARGEAEVWKRRAQATAAQREKALNDLAEAQAHGSLLEQIVQQQQQADQAKKAPAQS